MQGFVITDQNLYELSEAKVSLLDRSMHFGDNCFEGMLLLEAGILFLHEHISRLYQSAKYLNLKLPEKENFLNILKQAVSCAKSRGFKTAYMRVLASRGLGDLGIDPTICADPKVRVIVSQLSLYSEEKYEKGISLFVADHRKFPISCLDCCNVKHGNYLQNILSKGQARQNGADDALILTTDNYVCEASVANIFAIKNGKIFTPSLETNCLAGITRKAVINIALDQGYELSQGMYLLQDFSTADEVFITGTAAGILAVTKINDKVIGSGNMGQVTRKLREDYIRRCAGFCTLL